MFRKRVGDYYLGRTLGEGTHATVKYGRHALTSAEVAVKVLDKRAVAGDGGGGVGGGGADAGPPPARAALAREVAILRRLAHPHLVALRDVLASADKVYVVLEFVGGGDLFDRVAAEGPLPDADARRVAHQLADALAYCHAAGVAHRDLKPENVLLTRDGDAKLSDFGLGALTRGPAAPAPSAPSAAAAPTPSFLLTTACGTPAFVAPEVLRGGGYAGPPADMWSLGVTLAVAVTGRLPFDAPSLPALFRRVAVADYRLPRWTPAGAADLIGKLLVVDPAARLDAEGVLAHPWVAAAGLPRAPAEAARVEDDDEEEAGVGAPWTVVPAETRVGGAGAASAPTTPHPPPPASSGVDAWSLLAAALDLSRLLDDSGAAGGVGAVRRHTRFTARVASLDALWDALAAAAGAVGGSLTVNAATPADAGDDAARRPPPSTRATLDVPPARAGGPRVGARLNVARLLPGLLLVDAYRARGTTAADFYGAWGGFEAAALRVLARRSEGSVGGGGGGRAAGAAEVGKQPAGESGQSGGVGMKKKASMIKK